MKNIMVSNRSLALAFALVLVSIAISAEEKLGLTRDILISVVRAIVQLIVISYVLKFISRVNNYWLTFASTLIIIFNASWNANQRGPNPDKKFYNSLIAEAAGAYATLAILIPSGMIKPIPMQVVPITGMTAGNGMVVIGLYYRPLNESFRDLRQPLLEKLALGSDTKTASMPILRRSIKTAVQPMIDPARTVGLTNLPGMMSGLISAGINPICAIKYQIMITFMLLGATSLGAVTAGYLVYRDYFSERMQLKG